MANHHTMGARKKLQTNSYPTPPLALSRRRSSSRPRSGPSACPTPPRKPGAATTVLVPARRAKVPLAGSQVVTHGAPASAERANGPCRKFELMGTRRHACTAHRNRHGKPHLVAVCERLSSCRAVGRLVTQPPPGGARRRLHS